MLRELPHEETDHNADYARWQFEAARAEWEAEQPKEMNMNTEGEQETLESVRADIKKLKRTVNKLPYSHNIIGLKLSRIAREYGKPAANKTIELLGLDKLGWSKRPE